MSKLDRRLFIKQGLAATAVSTFAIGRSGAAPSEKVNMAFVGLGARAGQDANSLLKTGMVNPVAFCDVDSRAGAKLRQKYPKVPFFQDFRKMFDKAGKQFDAVCVGTPDRGSSTPTRPARSGPPRSTGTAGPDRPTSIRSASTCIRATGAVGSTTATVPSATGGRTSSTPATASSNSGCRPRSRR